MFESVGTMQQPLPLTPHPWIMNPARPPETVCAPNETPSIQSLLATITFGTNKKSPDSCPANFIGAYSGR